MHKNMRLSILCHELITEILSWLPVKSLLRFMCVCKWFQSLISDPSFVKLHLQRSPKSTNFLLRYCSSIWSLNHHLVFPCSVRSLLENPSSPVTCDLSPGARFDLQRDHYENNRDKYWVMGSCNGLACFVRARRKKIMFSLWNPATRKTYEDLQYILDPHSARSEEVMFGFGYDIVSDTYKVVTVFFTYSFKCISLKPREVKVCSISDNNCWRNIQSFPADPTGLDSDGVYLNNTLNWLVLALPHDHGYYNSDITFDELVIVSLDLANETYTQFLLPRSLDGVSVRDFYYAGHEFNEFHRSRTFGVLKDCLSLFLYSYKTKYFSTWQMKEFGNKKSWTPLLNIAVQDLQIDWKLHHNFNLLPLIMFENGSVLLIDNSYFPGTPLRAILHDGRDNTIKHIEISKDIFQVYGKDYVQSLVSPRRY